MPRYPETTNTGNVPSNVLIEEKLLHATRDKACILVLGPHLAVQQSMIEAQNTSKTSFYLKDLLGKMVAWCKSSNIISQPDTIETLHRLLHKNSLVHAVRILEEYLTEKDDQQHCLAEVLGTGSQISALHRVLVHLPVRGYISTTYDTFIETAYIQAHQRILPRFYTSSIDSAILSYQHEEPFILKLYGDVDNAQAITFGQRVNEGLSSIGEKRNELRKLLAMSEVLFLGFEESDLDLQYLKGLLQESQSYTLFSLSQLQHSIEKHLANNWEDRHNIITVFNSRSSASPIAVLPDAETHSLPTASTGSYARKPRSQERPLQTHADQAPPIEIYIVYTYNDKSFFNRIKKQLKILSMQKWHISCHESEITNSTEWQGSDHLATANIILLLVSDDLLASPFCYCEEMEEAIKRHKTDNRCCIIPITLHSLPDRFLKKTPFGKLKFLPTNGKPISAWRDAHDAYVDIVNYILDKIEDMQYFL